MKKILFTISLFFVISNALQAQTCQAFGLKYDSKAPWGKEVCSILSNLDQLSDGLGKNYNNVVNRVTDDVTKFIDDLTKDAINKDALKSFAKANARMKVIEERIEKLIRDPQCGAPGVYTKMVELFSWTARTLNELQQIGASSFDALKKLQPVAGRTGQIIGQLTNVASIIAGKSPEIDQKLSKLISLVKSLHADLEKVSALDFAKLASSTSSLVTNVGPFLIDCSTCAGTIGTTLSGMTAGAGGSGAGVVTSETGVGATLIPGGALVAGISSAFGSIMANPACKGMVEKGGKIDSYISDMAAFIKAAGELAEQITSNTQKIVATSKALAELTQAIAEEAKPHFKKVQVQLSLITEDMKNTVASFNQNVRPKIEKISASTLAAVLKNTKQLYDCYKQFSSVTGMISKDMIDAAGLLADASVNLVDAKKLYDNLMDGVSKKQKSAITKVKEDWEKLDKARDRFIRELLGNKTSDPASMIRHLTEKIINFNTIKESVENLVKVAKKASNFASSCVKDAFDTIPSAAEVNNIMNQVKGKYANALRKISEAEDKLKIQRNTASL